MNAWDSWNEKKRSKQRCPWVDCESYKTICWAGMKDLIQFSLYILAAVLILWGYSAWKSRERDQNIHVN